MPCPMVGVQSSLPAVEVAVSDSVCWLLPSDGGCCYQYRRLELSMSDGGCCLMVAVVNTGCLSVCVRWSVYCHYCQRWECCTSACIVGVPVSDSGCCYQYRRSRCGTSACIVGVSVSDGGCCLLPSDGGCCYQYRLFECRCPMVGAACCRVRWSVYSHHCQRWKLPCPIVCVGCCPLMVGVAINTGCWSCRVR